MIRNQSSSSRPSKKVSFARKVRGGWKCLLAVIMGRRYLCEYCDRAFADTLPSRKRHIKSIQHQRLKKLHYDSFKGERRKRAGKYVTLTQQRNLRGKAY